MVFASPKGFLENSALERKQTVNTNLSTHRATACYRTMFLSTSNSFGGPEVHMHGFHDGSPGFIQSQSGLILTSPGANFMNRLKLSQLSLCVRFKPKILRFEFSGLLLYNLGHFLLTGWRTLVAFITVHVYLSHFGYFSRCNICVQKIEFELTRISHFRQKPPCVIYDHHIKFGPVNRALSLFRAVSVKFEFLSD